MTTDGAHSSGNLVRSRFLLLDTAQIGDWARDARFGSSHQKAAANDFTSALLDAGLVIVLTYHHIEELLAIDDLAVAAERVHHLQSLPMVAWMPSVHDRDLPGGITDIMAIEIATAYGSRQADLFAIRDTVKKQLFEIGTGERALGPFANWRDFRPLFIAHAKKQREIVAIDRSRSIPDFRKLRLKDLAKYKTRSGEQAQGQLTKMFLNLVEDIANRGDKRISQPKETAANFFSEVLSQPIPLPPTKVEDLLNFTLRLAGLEKSDANFDLTLGDLLEEIEFSRHLQLAAEQTGIPYLSLRARLSGKMLPYRVISSSLRIHEQDLLERKGSAMTDNYLACLSTYADFAFVDKRTMENIKRARQHTPSLRTLLCGARKSTRYERLLATLPTPAKPQVCRPS